MVNEFSKKEKGTQGVPSSGKIQSKYTKNVTVNVLKISEKFLEDLFKRYNSLSDPLLIRENEILIRDFLILKRLVELDPRLPWQVIQGSIDNLYERDKNIVGVNVKIIFNDLKKGNLNKYIPSVYGISG